MCMAYAAAFQWTSCLPGSSRVLHPTSPSFQASQPCWEAFFQSTHSLHPTKNIATKHPRTTNSSKRSHPILECLPVWRISIQLILQWPSLLSNLAYKNGFTVTKSSIFHLLILPSLFLNSMTTTNLFTISMVCLFHIPGEIHTLCSLFRLNLWLNIYHISTEMSEIKNYATYATSHYLPLSSERKKKNGCLLPFNYTSPIPLLQTPCAEVLGVPGCLSSHLPWLSLSPDPFIDLLGPSWCRWHPQVPSSFLGSFTLAHRPIPYSLHSPKRVMNV